MIMNINGLADYHIHTCLCKHAEGEVRDYKATALRRQITEICFTDHMPSFGGYDPAHRMDVNQYPSYREMIASLQDRETPAVLYGIEADYYEGCEPLLRRWLPSQDFDFVLGSVHYIDQWGFDNPEERHIWDSVDIKTTWRKYFQLVERLARSGLADAIGHIDLPKKFGYRPSERDLKEMVKPVLDTIAGAGIGMEVNTSGLRKPVGEIYPSPLIISMARERDIPICFGSDAHRAEEIGADFALALDLVREAGYTHYFRMNRSSKRLIPLPQGIA
jgi:histidinol-phosphatase (PHP family)